MWTIRPRHGQCLGDGAVGVDSVDVAVTQDAPARRTWAERRRQHVDRPARAISFNWVLLEN
jgi:hypothetical protein